MQLPAELLYFK